MGHGFSPGRSPKGVGFRSAKGVLSPGGDVDVPDIPPITLTIAPQAIGPLSVSAVIQVFKNAIFEETLGPFTGVIAGEGLDRIMGGFWQDPDISALPGMDGHFVTASWGPTNADTFASEHSGWSTANPFSGPSIGAVASGTGPFTFEVLMGFGIGIGGGDIFGWEFHRGVPSFSEKLLFMINTGQQTFDPGALWTLNTETTITLP